MTTPEKCEVIIRRIVELANEERPVKFEQDFGGNTLTIYIGDMHTHCGVPNGAFDLLVDNLYNAVTGGPGLSFAK